MEKPGCEKLSGIDKTHSKPLKGEKLTVTQRRKGKKKLGVEHMYCTG
jgi:hypothetical protein